jgi:CDP-diacylglycerol--serine O-phosphatidyltransferase
MKFINIFKKKSVPSLLSLLNLIFGFLAIILIFNQQYYLSANMIIIAFIFDLLDGVAARKLGVVTKMGAQLDSFADSVSFVIAPALLIYSKYFTTFRIGIIVAAFIVIFGILRLAKFNIMGSTKNFIGMPTPYFAAIAIAFILGSVTLRVEVTAILFFILAYMMISPMKYPSFKEKGASKYKYLGLIVLVFLAIAFLLQFNRWIIILIEYGFLWGLLLIPMFFDKKFVLKKPLLIFDIGLILLTWVFYTNSNFLLVLPIIYSAIASPLLELSLKPNYK